MKPTRDDLAAYVMGSYDGDVAALEAALAADEVLRAQLAEEAELELLLRDAAAAATFCPACDDLVRGERCAACGAAVRPGGYVVEKILVANAHGRMYVARDADGKQVALKELAFVQSPGADAVAAFEREARFLRALEHPAIPRFLAAFEEGEGVHTRYYLAQELVTGESLEARLDQHFYAEAEIVALARAVLEVLVYLQSLSPMVIHRDIKPANLIRRADGSIALVDFGAAHVQGHTAGSTSIGTFGYMPIEQLAGQVDATTDLYALGASLVHLLTRQEPWRIMNAELIGTINVSAPLRRFLQKLVAPRREDRFPSAAAALAALEQREALPAPRTQRDWRTPILVALGATALAAGAGAAGYALRGGGATPEEVPAPAASSACNTLRLMSARIASCHAMPRQGRDRLLSVVDQLLAAADRGEQPAHACAEVQGEVERQLESQCPFGGSAAWAWGTQELPPVVRIPRPPTPPDPPAPPDPPEPPPPPVELHDYLNPKKLSAEFKAAPLADVLRTFGRSCGTNIVLPDSVQASVTITLKEVPCDQATEVLLEAHNLWYRYRPDGKLLEIYPRRQIDMEDEEAAARRKAGTQRADDALPAGTSVDLDLKDAPLQDVLRMLADAGKVNMIVPDSIRGKVTVRLDKVKWDVALRAVLGTHNLGYRFREKGKVVRVAPARELLMEDEEARARGQR